MLYLAPIKYYNENGQLRIWRLIEDFAIGELSSEQLRQIEKNLQIFQPRAYHELLRHLRKELYK